MDVPVKVMVEVLVLVLVLVLVPVLLRLFNPVGALPGRLVSAQARFNSMQV